MISGMAMGGLSVISNTQLELPVGWRSHSRLIVRKDRHLGSICSQHVRSTVGCKVKEVFQMTILGLVVPGSEVISWLLLLGWWGLGYPMGVRWENSRVSIGKKTSVGLGNCIGGHGRVCCSYQFPVNGGGV